MAIATDGLTLEAFLQLPEEKPYLEYEDGVVTPKVSPKTRHSILGLRLASRLDEAGLAGRLARAFPELRVTFGGRSYVPDISIFSWERLPVDGEGAFQDDVYEPPDIAIEIVSPDQRVTAQIRRCLWFVENGVRVALIVDPADESVLAFRPDRTAAAWHGADTIDVHEVLPDFDLTVDELFASLRHV